MNRILIFSLAIASALILSGCFTVNLGGESSKSETKSKNGTVMLANPLNVYRTSTNVVIKTLVQNKRGKWVESDGQTLIPSGWYIVSGDGLEDDVGK